MVTNQTSGIVFLIDYSRDRFLGSAIGQGFTTQREYISADRKVVLIYDDAQHILAYFDPAQEKDVFDYVITGRTESVVISSDNKFAYAAVPTYEQENSVGAVLVLDLTTGGIRNIINSPAAARVALSPDNKNLLVFAGDVNTFSYIDLTATPPVSVPVPAVPGTDRPYMAFFDASSATAWILNCANGCGGTAHPSVQSIDIASLKTGLAADPKTPPTAGIPIEVGGASLGLLDGTKLYVAGNNRNSGQLAAKFSSVNLSSSSVEFTADIGDGFHNVIAKSKNNKVWIGAATCSNTGTGCLSIVDLGSQAVTRSEPNGPVTGMAEVTSRDLMYVCEGGELRNYDINTAVWTMPMDVSGFAYDVKVLD